MSIPVIETLARAVLGPIVVAAVFGQKALATGRTDDWLTATFPRAALLAFAVMTGMSGPGNEHQIFEAVIGPLAIAMMYQFVGFQSATQIFAHYQTMLSYVAHISFLERVGMVGAQEIYIALIANEPTALPAWISLSAPLVSRNVSRILALLDAPECSFARRKLLATTTFAFHESSALHKVSLVL